MILERRVISGELHYPRIPRGYWRDRLRMARAMGLDTVSTYVFWNRHELEPGKYDFSDDNDVAAFVRLAQEEDLDVILRPGPYVCAEWDFGSLPWWLLKSRVPIRSTHESYMRPVRAWLLRLGRELAPLQRALGGPIVAVQLENEYGAFASDRAYLRALRSAIADAGFAESPLFTIDQPAHLASGSLDELPIAATFAPGDPAKEFEHVRRLRSQAPLLCGEYWAGWFDHWGEPHHVLDAAQQERDLRWMLREGCSVNIYMFHGGTNFGFWNGANSSETSPYLPTTTSYDYDAALDEAGRPTAKYFLFRDAIAGETRAAPPPIPPAPRTASSAPFELHESCALLCSNLGEPVHSERLLSMEDLNQGYGFVLYRARVDGPFDALLEIEGLRDYAIVALDGIVAGHLDRRLGQTTVRLSCSSAKTQLDILVENCGRINYGPDMPFERKGITGAVRLEGREVLGWQMHSLPFAHLDGFVFSPGAQAGPAFYRGTMNVSEPADTFLDVSDLGKGVLFVNGKNAGRFWNIGPQRSLYVPGLWLRGGSNDVIAFDLYAHERCPRLRGVPDPLVT